MLHPTPAISSIHIIIFHFLQLQAKLDLQFSMTIIYCITKLLLQPERMTDYLRVVFSLFKILTITFNKRVAWYADLEVQSL